MTAQRARGRGPAAAEAGTPTSKREIKALFDRIAAETNRPSKPPDRQTNVFSHTAMRRRIIESLEAQGFSRHNGTLVPPEFQDKDEVRKKNVPAVQLALAK